MSERKDLEKVMEERDKEKIVDNAFHKYLGVSIKELNQDITKKIQEPLIDFLIEDNMTLKSAKKNFLKYYILRLLEKHNGNVKAASYEAKTNRRTLHRMIKEMHIDTSLIRKKKSETIYETKIHNVIEESLHKYEDIIHPKRLNEVYNKISEISKTIAINTDNSNIQSLKDAENMFEAIFLTKIIKKNNGNLSKSAKEIGVRYETLHRKITGLKIKGLI